MCFKMKMPQIQMPSVTTTARELVPQIESKEPESPIFGDGVLLTTAKKKGTASLKIDLKPNTNNKYYSTFNY